MSAARGSAAPEALREGLVVASHGRRAEVEDASGERVDCAVHRRLAVVAGDRVGWRPLGDGGGIVMERRPRASLLARPDHRGRLDRRRPVAANVDRVLVVIAPVPRVTDTALDAYLVAAERLGLDAAVVLNKADLLAEPERAAAAPALERRLAVYRAAGYATFRVSAVTGAGLPALQAELEDRLSVLVGVSGVGKSSLSATLAPGADIAVGGLTRSGAQGRHTTSASRLHALAGGGAIIDSPGIRDFGLWRMPAREIAAGFPEIRAAAAHCRFRDCRHGAEPGCAVTARLTDDAAGPGIAGARYASYRQLLDLYAEDA